MVYNDTNGLSKSSIIFYRENGKKVQIKSFINKLRSEATCHKEDEFDFNKGFILARRRLIVKILQKEVEDFAKAM